MESKFASMFKMVPVLGLSAAILSACADPPGPTDTGGTPPTELQTVAFCYSGQTTTRDQLFAMALAECPAGTRSAEVWEHDTFFNSCPLSKKNRVTFRCLGY